MPEAPAIFQHAGITSGTAHAAIDQIEAALLSLPPVDIPVVHHQQIPGVYIREAIAPTGTILTSKIHKHRHTFTIVEGEVSTWVEGEGVRRVRAPFCGVTEAGTRRVIVVHEATRWVTVHITDKIDLSEVEDDLIDFRPVAATIPFEELIAIAANPVDQHALPVPAEGN